ncbi:hypothetical protein SEA_DRHAYES_56 [Mycobacterium phage DrHayes]|uniref:Uncharacterized protein n=2 Tax=Anayavirus TaxID=2946797 RepID=A0A222Z228_9CAUD|nr:hypothetical protein I5G95_gp47 [Mycobacterium phage Bella96]YP_009954037.1 hypothetical protein I5H07_gp47 [Mycobacterium phage Urkel]AOZ61387.1 hypothetical protein SEA_SAMUELLPLAQSON_56 [Mycobacterium phage SamuelLPlaqson]AOZ61484.1 hypothetical protein SEA_DRHAYES_56 [Mycobacterium phage DrHayes]AOZ61581.1 hypothetical protein SEA_URKEL_56 [Mycobacterium phage Urkel]ASR77987.1 hypothetical protein SEA_BELLA96_56 [Mycobacterium phage Bella96]
MDISEVKGHVDLLAHARIEKAKWAEIEKNAKAAVDEALGGDDEGTVDGQVVVKRTRTKVTRLSSKLVQSLHPAVYAECLDTSEQTRVSVVGK